MLTQGRFLISYQVFDNIQVNNIGQTHVREISKIYSNPISLPDTMDGNQKRKI